MFPSPTVEIESSRLIIRLVRESDLVSVLEINADDFTTQFLPYESWKSYADAEAWYERCSTRFSSGESAQFVIALRDTGCVIATCLLFRFEQASARAEVGYVQSKSYCGQGYMTEAIQSLVMYAFDKLELRRLDAVVDPRNKASARLLERLGFVKEGQLRQHSVLKGEITDSSLYGLLRSEWALTRVQRG